jgi:RNA polymerase sigma-70 factor (ECF subfamily)
MRPSGFAPAPAGPFEQRLAAARDGSPHELGELFETCRNYLLMVANRELDAELQAKGGGSDLVQETFLDAQRDFGGFRGRTEADLLNWLRAILRHNLANFRRRYHATDRRAVNREVPLDDTRQGDELRAALADDVPTPSGVAVAREEVQLLERALERLPEIYRQVIRLRHQEQRAFEDIGNRLGRSEDAARQLWVRAIAQLQKELRVP